MKFQQNFNSHILTVLAFFLVSGSLIFSWFRHGFVYGGGDVGLQTYNPLRILEISSYIWWEATGPGSPTPQGLTAVPFNLIFSPLKLLGFSPVFLQSSLFFLILLSMGLGMYFLIIFLFGREYKKYAVFGGLFYIFNPYMMIQVWHRFVHSTFFFSAALPFLIIFWLKWIRNKDVKSLLVFLFINLLALYSFGTIAYIITLWLCLILITTAEIIFPWSNLKNAKWRVLLFFIGFAFWFLTNVWWLFPIFKIAPSFLSEQHSNEQTLATLYTLGYQTALPYSLQMINPFYLFSQLDFGPSYTSIFIRIIPWLFIAIIFIGLVRGIFEKNSAKWSVLYLLVLIFSKGVASPFGYFYVLGMTYFFPLGVLRNPFEKVGVLLPLVSAILLVIGTKILFDFFREKMGKKIVNICLTLTFLVIFSFCWPMFTGQIFGKLDKPEFVKVPESYAQADQWIKSDYQVNSKINPGKILHLPLTKGEGISYAWDYGYSGLESSALLFTAAPSVSHGFNLKQVDNSLTSIYQAIHSPSISSETVLRLLQDFNIKYVVLHKDVKWQGGEFYDPEQTEGILNSLTFLQTPKKFDDLVIYKVSDNSFRTKISFSSGFDLIYPPNSASLWPWILSEGRTLITDLNSKKNDTIDVLSTNTLIFPKKTFTYSEASSSSTILLINQLISNQSLDEVWLNPLLQLKKIYRTNNEIQGEELNDKWISANKKVLQILRSILVENKGLSTADLEDYADEMNQILSSNSAILSYYAQNKTISAMFQTHLYMLRVITSKLEPNNQDKVVKIGNNLKTSLIKDNFISSYYNEGENSSLLEKLVLKFEIPKDSNYELLLTSSGEKDIYKDKYNKITTIIDGKVNSSDGKQKDNIISLGQVFLNKGNHEIDLPLLFSDNLISNKREGMGGENITLLDDESSKIDSKNNKVGYFENKIDYVSGEDTYQINFSAKIEKGNGFYIQLTQDTDTLQKDRQKNYQVNQFIEQTPNQDFTDYNFPLPPLRTSTKNASIRFLVAPSGNEGLGGPNSIIIRNLSVVRLFNGDILLRKINSSLGNVSMNNTVTMEQKSPVLYTGKFLVDKPTFIVFSESYHPGWELTLLKNGKNNILPSHFLANLYSNAWYIDQIGDYNFKLEFKPQKIVNYGLIIAIISYAGLFLSILIMAFKIHEKK